MAYWVVKAVLTPVLVVCYRVRCRGRRHVPRRGGVILASNHQSFIDSLFVPLCVPRRVTYLAKAEYFDSPKTAWFFRAVGQIPIRRGGGSTSERALQTAREVLDAGGVLGIYPEGTRSPDGRLYRGHTGVARIALACGVPVVPVACIGTADVQPIGAMRPRLFRRVTVRFGPPLRWPALEGAEADRATLRQVTDEIMDAIAHLSGQERARGYAEKERQRGERGPAAALPARPQVTAAAVRPGAG